MIIINYYFLPQKKLVKQTLNLGGSLPDNIQVSDNRIKLIGATTIVDSDNNTYFEFTPDDSGFISINAEMVYLKSAGVNLISGETGALYIGDESYPNVMAIYTPAGTWSYESNDNREIFQFNGTDISRFKINTFEIESACNKFTVQAGGDVDISAGSNINLKYGDSTVIGITDILTLSSSQINVNGPIEFSGTANFNNTISNGVANSIGTYQSNITKNSIEIYKLAEYKVDSDYNETGEFCKEYSKLTNNSLTFEEEPYDAAAGNYNKDKVVLNREGLLFTKQEGTSTCTLKSEVLRLYNGHYDMFEVISEGNGTEPYHIKLTTSSNTDIGDGELEITPTSIDISETVGIDEYDSAIRESITINVSYFKSLEARIAALEAKLQ